MPANKTTSCSPHKRRRPSALRGGSERPPISKLRTLFHGAPWLETLTEDDPSGARSEFPRGDGDAGMLFMSDLRRPALKIASHYGREFPHAEDVALHELQRISELQSSNPPSSHGDRLNMRASALLQVANAVRGGLRIYRRRYYVAFDPIASSQLNDWLGGGAGETAIPGSPVEPVADEIHDALDPELFWFEIGKVVRCRENISNAISVLHGGDDDRRGSKRL